MTRLAAAIFDLDGTLVQTEALKARSYARAAVELSPTVRAQEIILAYHDMVGHSREEVAATLLARFELGAHAERRMRELGAATPLDAYMTLRLGIYEAMISDAKLIREQEYPWSTTLLREVRRAGHPVGIATMSHRKHAVLVLDRLGLTGDVEVLVTREDVRDAKPSPEIYTVIATLMGTPPEHCFVLEDSVPGVRSALAAGMSCVAITNDMTRDAIHAAMLLPAELVVDDPSRLGAVARGVLEDLAKRG
ncbi:MAG: HAD family phosphatase [Gemmatimonadota bacterium]|nr:HAD family phosphatase [Gemmatimonadota bacterium]